MFLLTLRDNKEDGAYAVQNRYGEKVLFLFEEEDDAERYAMQLEDNEEAEMDVVEEFIWIINLLKIKSICIKDCKSTRIIHIIPEHLIGIA